MHRLSLLLLVASLFAAGANAQSATNRLVISAHGAVGDGETVNTVAIQAAIDRLAASGGGVIVVPEGVFRTGSLFFKQGVNLHLERGGVLKGTTNPADYPQIPTRWEGIERVWTAAMINFIDMRGAEVSGEGILDGSGDEWVLRNPRRGSGGQAQAQAQPAPAVTPPQPAAPAGPRAGRPRLIGFTNCQDVRVMGIQLKNQASWGLFVLYSEDVVIDGLFIRADHNIPSSDGIDIDSSRRVHILNCDIDVNDDCISIKSGKDEDGLRVNRPSEDILIEKIRFGYGHGGVAMGSETSGGIRNVEIRDCVAEDGNWAPIRFKSQPSRGGVVENITYRNIKLNGTRQAVEFNLAWRMVPPVAPPAKVLPVVRNVRFINVSGTVTAGGIIRGLEDSPIQGVTFEDCEITATRPLVIEHAVNVNTAGLKLTVAEGEPVIVR